MTKKKKKHVTDERMLLLMRWAISNNKALNESHFAESIGLLRQNLSNIKAGLQSFTKDHILQAAKTYNANVNWIFGLDKQMTRQQSKSPVERLREVLAELEAEEKKKAKQK